MRENYLKEEKGKLRQATKRILLVTLAAAAMTACLCFGIFQRDDTTVQAATTPKYTMTFSGTYTYLSWGANGRSTTITNQTKVEVPRAFGTGAKDDLILYISGTSTSGSGVLADNAYINFSNVTISCSLSTAELTLYNSAGSEIVSGKGTITASLSASNETYRINLFQKKQSGGGYTQWGYAVNVDSHFKIDVTAPAISGASTSTTGKYTNAAFTVSASDSGSGLKNLYMKAPNSSSFISVGSSKTILRGSINGRYAFYAEDNCQNRSPTYYVNFDDTIPQLHITGAEFGTTATKGFTVTTSDANAVTLYYKYETDSWKAVGTSYTVPDTAKDGVHYFYAVDKLNNRSEEYWVRLMAADPIGQFVKSSIDNTVYFTWDRDYWTATLDGKPYMKGVWIMAEGKHTIVLSNGAGKSTSYPFNIDHYYVKGVTIPPTCTEQGYTEYTCRQCGAVKEADFISKNGHRYQMASNPPTCTEMGETVYTCEVCGFEYTQETEYPSGHNFTMTVEKSPTCTAEGLRRLHCDKCGYEYTSVIRATGHNYQITNETKENDTVWRTYTCANCGESYTQELGNQAEEVTNYVEYLFEQYSPYMVWVFLATAGVWSIVLGVMIIVAHKNEEKEKAKKMLVNYIIGLVVIFGILVAAPYLVRGIAALVG